jgi:uncharacterized protein YeaO (DUF488 family)
MVPEATDGARARGGRIAAGLVERLAAREGWSAREEDGAFVLAQGGDDVARVRGDAGFAVVDVDPHAGGLDVPSLRRLGVPHPDRAMSKAGWRRADVRTRRDGDAVVTALRSRVAARPRAAASLLVGRVAIRRVDAPPRPEDGERVLVEPAWPRGLDREAARVAIHVPAVAPSATLARAFGPAPTGRRGFRRAYLSELRGSAKAEAVSRLRSLLRKGPVTLLVAVREPESSFAVVLADALSRPHTPRG